MRSGSYGVFSARPAEFDAIRDVVVGVLERENFALRRRKAGKHEMRVVGVHGNQLLALLASVFRPLGVLGIGKCVQATVVCRRSLTEGDTDFPLTIWTKPIDEAGTEPARIVHERRRA